MLAWNTSMAAQIVMFAIVVTETQQGQVDLVNPALLLFHMSVILTKLGGDDGIRTRDLDLDRVAS